MFLRDIWPELAKDGEFRLDSEAPGVLRFVQGLPGSESSLEGLADPDVIGQPEEDDEPAVTRAVETDERGFTTDPQDAATRAGLTHFTGLTGRVTATAADDALFYSGFARLLDRRIRVTFSAVSEGTKVEIKGFAEKRLAHALTELGSIGHWPETADDPHD